MILLMALFVAIWFAGFLAAAVLPLEWLWSRGFGVALVGGMGVAILYIGLTLQILSWTGVLRLSQ